MTAPQVIRYQDFRTFLSDMYRFRKKSEYGYTFARFANSAGLKSPNILKLVMDGKKNLTTESIQRFAKGIGFVSIREIEIFEALVLENQATDVLEKRYYRRRLNRLRKESKAGQSLRINSKFGLFDDPLLPTLLCALTHVQVGQEIPRLRSSLGYVSDRILKLVDLLKIRNILEEKEGLYVPNASHYVFHEKVSGTKLRSYLLRQLNYSRRAFDQSYDQGAKFYSHSMKLAPARFDELQAAIRDFIGDINRDFDNLDSTELIQLNIQSFRPNKEILDLAAE